MDNNTEPDNKDIPDNSSDQHISPDETGDFTTPEELAECAANIDECESVGYLTGGNTFVTAQPEQQTQEQFDRKPLEVKLFNMGFTTEKIASMSDDELKEAVEANTGFEPEFVFGGGLIISEYPLGSKPEKYHFPQRNRIISGLSDGVLVIEAKEKSGTLITVDYALDQGRDVYAIPGNIEKENSYGTNNLIKEGAIPVTRVEDINI